MAQPTSKEGPASSAVGDCPSLFLLNTHRPSRQSARRPRGYSGSQKAEYQRPRLCPMLGDKARCTKGRKVGPYQVKSTPCHRYSKCVTQINRAIGHFFVKVDVADANLAAATLHYGFTISANHAGVSEGASDNLAVRGQETRLGQLACRLSSTKHCRPGPLHVKKRSCQFGREVSFSVDPYYNSGWMAMLQKHDEVCAGLETSECGAQPETGSAL